MRTKRRCSRMMERGAPLLLTGRSAPALWPVSLPDLASRFRALVAFELREPDEALLMALAVKLFADRQLIVPEAVVTSLVRDLERTPAAIRDFITKADAGSHAPAKTRKSPIGTGAYGGSGEFVMTDSPISPKCCAMSTPSPEDRGRQRRAG